VSIELEQEQQQSSPSLSISMRRKRSHPAAAHVASSAINMNRKARHKKCIAPTQKIDQMGSVASVMSIDRSCNGAASPFSSRSSVIAHAMLRTGGSSRSSAYGVHSLHEQTDQHRQRLRQLRLRIVRPGAE
jgi:hypothetical protein